MHDSTAENNPPEEKEDSASEEPINFVPAIDDIQIAREFITSLGNASLDHRFLMLDADLVEQIRNPPSHILSIDNPTDQLSLDLFLAIDNASQETYNAVRDAIKRHFPDEDVLSYYNAKRLVETLTGVTPIVHDMCFNSCVGFTGPYFETDTCPTCGESRYDANGNARKQFSTIPLAPQLQAVW